MAASTMNAIFNTQQPISICYFQKAAELNED